MTGTGGTEPDELQLRESAEAVRAEVERDPDLADDVRLVLRHLAATPIDPTGAPE